MGKLKQQMIEIIDESRTIEAHGKYYTCHPTAPVPWSELHNFIKILEAIYKLDGREILEMNSYHSDGRDFHTGEQVKPVECGIEITWVEARHGQEF